MKLKEIRGKIEEILVELDDITEKVQSDEFIEKYDEKKEVINKLHNSLKEFKKEFNNRSVNIITDDIEEVNKILAELGFNIKLKACESDKCDCDG